MASLTFPWDERFIPSRRVKERFGLGWTAQQRWREYTGLDDRDTRGQGTRVMYSPKRINQLLVFHTICDREGLSNTQTPLVQLYRWMWVPALEALESHSGGWVVAEPDKWERHCSVSDATAHLMRIPFGSLIDLNMPYSLMVWLDLLWREHEGT